MTFGLNTKALDPSFKHLIIGQLLGCPFHSKHVKSLCPPIMKIVVTFMR